MRRIGIHYGAKGGPELEDDAKTVKVPGLPGLSGKGRRGEKAPRYGGRIITSFVPLFALLLTIRLALIK